MADLPAGAHQCTTRPRPIWQDAQCGSCQANAKEANP